MLPLLCHGVYAFFVSPVLELDSETCSFGDMLAQRDTQTDMLLITVFYKGKDDQWRFQAGAGGRHSPPQIVARPPNLACLKI